MISAQVYTNKKLIVIDYGPYIYLWSRTCAVWPPGYSPGLFRAIELTTAQKSVLSG